MSVAAPKKRARRTEEERLAIKAEGIRTELENLKAKEAQLKSERNSIIFKLCDLGVPERKVGELTGVTGPRVNQIYNGEG